VTVVAENKPTVLLIDDELLVRKSLSRILARQYQVKTAESGEAGLALLERDPQVDVVICDLYLPDRTGLDIRTWLLEHRPALARRMVFMTGSASADDWEDLLYDVPNPVLEKPFDPLSLVQLVDRLLQEPAE
jgi:CheY-like chemotaxis protein